MQERLQKVLARVGVASRRAAERMISDGRVSINGEITTRLGTCVDAQRDAIKVDGKRIRTTAPAPIYLMLHKPRGCVTTLSDPEGRPTVAELLYGVSERVFPVGRLDFNSEGLLLLTNDGELADRLMQPGGGVEKTYLAKVRGVPDGRALGRLARGVEIDGRRTRPAKARVVRRGPNSWVELTIVEGRKHQVRRMLEAVGHPVSKLRRVAYGGLTLGQLPRGGCRRLRPDEVRRLERAAGLAKTGSPSPSRKGRRAL